MNIPLDPETAAADLLTDIFPPILGLGVCQGHRSAARWRMTDEGLFALARLLAADPVTRQSLAVTPAPSSSLHPV